VGLLTPLAGRWKADDTLLPGDTFKDCRECPEMVVIPAGTFRMGDLQGGGYLYEKPVHEVDFVPTYAGSL
jgi:formylglycine-generating enzyme required for sulfatase activity